MAQTVKCPSCGENNPANSTFCGGCGAKLVAQPSAPEVPPAPIVEREAPPPPAPLMPWATTASQNSANLIAQSLANAQPENDWDAVESFESEDQPARNQQGSSPAPRPQQSMPSPAPPTPRPTPPRRSGPATPRANPPTAPTSAPSPVSTATPQSVGTPQTVTTNVGGGLIFYDYQMIQVPPNIEVRGRQRGQEAAQYLQDICNRMSADGWEFHRIDTIGISQPPGCFAALLGARTVALNYYVITFRRPRR